MPKRIWAVVSVGFALCMSVLDINIVNIVLPTLSHDFGTTPFRDNMDYQRISVGYRHFTIVFLRLGRDDRLPESISFGHWAVLHYLTDLRTVRFVLDADGGTYLSRVQRFRHHEREYGTVAVYLPEEPAWTRDGD